MWTADTKMRQALLQQFRQYLINHLVVGLRNGLPPGSL